LAGGGSSRRREPLSLRPDILIPLPPHERTRPMFDKVANFLSEPLVLIVMVVLLLGLIGLMVFLRMRPKDDE
jgi:hypothetical protein